MGTWLWPDGADQQVFHCRFIHTLHVVCPSSSNPHFCIRDLHRPVPVPRQFRLDRVATFFFLTMLRQHSQYDSRLGFSFRVFVRVRLGLG